MPRIVLVLSILCLAACARDEREHPDLSGCVPTGPPAELRLDPFYAKHCSADGIPVVASRKVPDGALRWAWYQALRMTEKVPQVRRALIEQRVRIAVMAQSELTTDIPEHADLNDAFPSTDWDQRARGLGATVERPVISAAEENLLCLPGDVYVGESIFIHEFAHTIDTMGLRRIDRTWEDRLTGAYEEAMEAGRWRNTYAATDEKEYFAEGVQDWFNVNIESDPPNGIHNAVNTRAELLDHDPTLWALIAEVMPEDWQPTCPPDGI